MKRRIPALFCVLALCLAALSAALAAGTDTSSLYHLVINDHFFDSELDAATMPVRVNGVIYVPYTVFDRNTAGADFKISCGTQHRNGAYTLTLYSINGALIFDLNRGTATDVRGNRIVGIRAILRGGLPFIPIQSVCAYFNGLAGSTLVQYVYTDTEYGAIVRLRNEDCELSDYMFRQSALSSLRGRLDRYLQGQVEVQPSATAVPPTQAPATPGVTPTPDVVTVPPEVTPSSSVHPSVPVYLAFRCDSASAGLPDILDALSRARVTGLFLFRPEDLAEQAEQVRLVVGSGHTLGLIVPGSSAQEALEALETGNRALEEVAWTHTRVVLAEEAGRSVRSALEEAGISCWRGNVDGVSGSTAAVRASRVFSAAEEQSSAARITMDASALSAQALQRLLSRLESEGFPLRPAIETEF